MIVLSLFDGMACGYTALKRAGIPVTKYYASEIDPHAIQIAKKNHPDIVHLGDVENWYLWDIEKPDLIIGGSPCQGFSFAGAQLAFADPRSKLFFDYVHIRDHFKPDFFLLENVKMKKEYLDIISQYMGVDPMFINSNLVSAQNRQRFYWFNWGAPMPADRGLFLKDILVDDFSDDALLDKGQLNRLATSTDISKRFSVIDPPKAACMTARQYANWKGTFVTVKQRGRGNNPGFVKSMDKSPSLTSSRQEQNLSISTDNVIYRKLTPIECERLQTLPDDYTAGVSNTQRYRMLGNGWTVDVIAHLFASMPHDLI